MWIFSRALYGLRKRLAALREGTADYRSVQATSGVFACLRQAGPQQALVLISFNPNAVETEVSLPPEVTGLVQDVFSGQRLNATAPSHRDGSLSDACADSRVMFEPAQWPSSPDLRAVGRCAQSLVRLAQADQNQRLPYR